MKSECRCKETVGRTSRIEIKDKRMREVENERDREADIQPEGSPGHRRAVNQHLGHATRHPKGGRHPHQACTATRRMLGSGEEAGHTPGPGPRPPRGDSTDGSRKQ